MDRALETVEIVGLATHDDLKGFVVVIPNVRKRPLDAPLTLIALCQSGRPAGTVDTPGLPQPKVSEYEQHNDDCSDNPDDVVRHDVLRVFN